jgi:hypothetical protein
MNEEEVREKCVQLAEMAGGLAVEVKGLTIELELLKHYVNNMCAMIQADVPQKEFDLWVDDCKSEGLYTGDL